MAWTDRLREAAYSSPQGTRIRFDYEDVSYTVEKKTTSYEFPDADGTYVQDLGSSGRRIPLRVFLWGDDYDLQADQFMGLLGERGVGTLEHPKYGVVDVVPFGAIARRDDLKTAANQAVIEVTFWETTGIIYPSGQTDPASAVTAAVTGYNDSAAQDLADSLSLDTAVEQAIFKNNVLALTAGVGLSLAGVAAAEATVAAQFSAIDTSINAGIDTLVGEPLTLALQVSQLIQAPARSSALISDRLEAYSDLAASILAANGADNNLFRTRNLYASGYVTGQIVSAVNTQFDTRSDALATAETILALFDSVNNWRDAELTQLGEIDTGGGYQKLQEAAALAAGFLVEISFTLKQERTLTLDRDRTVIDLAAELYGSVDDRLDFLINSNDLSGSEILELPRGREIVYYV